MPASHIFRSKAALAALVALVMVILAGGCGTDSPSGPSAEDLKIEAIFVGSTILEPGDSTQVTAWVVRSDESPAVGVPVRFGTVGQGSAGSFLPSTATTDSLGRAQSTFHAGDTEDGEVNLKAVAGEDVGYATVFVVAEADLTLQITVTATESALPADGYSSLDLSIRVTHSGTPIPGQALRLVAGELFDDLDSDGVWSEGDELLLDADGDGRWDGVGSVTSPVVTDSTGMARAIYTAGVTEGSVFIKATTEGISTDFEVTLHSEQSTITVSAMPLEVMANGWEEVSVTAYVVDEQGDPLGGKLVRFTGGEPFEDSDGDGYYSSGEPFTDQNANGRWDVLGTITSWATTNLNGEASVAFFVGTTPGAATIYASTRESRSSAVVWLVELPRVHHAEWFWEDAWLYANGLSETILTLRPYDLGGTGLPGKQVRLVAGEPFTDNNGNGIYDAGIDALGNELIANGQWDALGTIDSLLISDPTNTIRATYRAPLSAGTVTIKASADDWSMDIPFAVEPLPDVVDIYFRSDEAEIALLGSGGVDRTTIRASCDFLGDVTVAEGVPVTLAITAGPGGGEGFEPDGASEITLLADVIGSVQAELRSGTLPGIVQLLASAGEVTRTLELGIAVGPPAQLMLVPSEAVLGSWEQTSVRAVVRDAYNNPVRDGTVVYFTTDEGLIQCGAGEATGRTIGGDVWAIYYSLAPEPDGDGTAVIEASVEPDLKAVTTIQVPVSDQSIQQMDVYANPAELVVAGNGNNDHSLLRAVCYVGPDIKAPSGLPVTFEILAGPDGGETINDSPEPVVAYTDFAGWADVTFKSGTKTGAVTVRVSANQGLVIRNLHLGISAGAPAGIVCHADSVALGYGSATAVTAIVHDEHNNPVADGTVVLFTTDVGLIYTDGGTGTTPTSSGYALATYQAPYDGDSGLEVATITVSTAGGSIVGETHVNLPADEAAEDPGPIARIELLPTRSEIGVRETGAVEQCELIATCYDADDRRVGRDRELIFEITAGPGGGESIEASNWGPVTAATDDQGQASATLQSGTISGTVRIEARADSTFASRSALVSIAAGPPEYISLGISPLNIRGWDVVGAEAEVTAIVSDIYGNPVRDSTTVYFTCDEGIVRGWDGNLGSAATGGGIALATYFSGQPRIDGIVELVASTAGGTVLGPGGLISSGPPVYVTFIGPSPPVYLIADGEDECLVTIEVLDVNGNYVLGGTEVGFRTDLGTIDEGAMTADGVYGSVAQAALTSEVLGRDYSYTVPDDGIGGVAQVEGFAGLAGAASDTLEVSFLTGMANRDNSRIDIDAGITVSTTVPFEIEIKDRYGNPLGGHLLSLSATGGASVSSGATTDSWGTAMALFTAPATDTVCVITAVDDDPGYGGGMILSKTVTVSD